MKKEYNIIESVIFLYCLYGKKKKWSFTPIAIISFDYIFLYAKLEQFCVWYGKREGSDGVCWREVREVFYDGL